MFKNKVPQLKRSLPAQILFGFFCVSTWFQCVSHLNLWSEISTHGGGDLAANRSTNWSSNSVTEKMKLIQQTIIFQSHRVSWFGKEWHCGETELNRDMSWRVHTITKTKQTIGGWSSYPVLWITMSMIWFCVVLTWPCARTNWIHWK